MLKQDTMQIEILEDGTIKISTDKVSMPNHVNADQFLQHVARQIGGASDRVRKGAVHVHQHDGITHSH